MTNNNIFGELIDSKPLALNIVVDDYYFSKHRILNNICLNLEGNILGSIKELSWHYDKIIISGSRIDRIIRVLKFLGCEKKYLSVDIDGGSITEFDQATRKMFSFHNVKQLRCCYFLRDVKNFDFRALRNKLKKLKCDKVLVIYITPKEIHSQTILTNFLIKNEFEGFDINILPIPQNVKDLGKYNKKLLKNFFINLITIEAKKHINFIYDFPCGSAINEKFDGFCPGYFTMVLKPNREFSFCKFSEVEFGRIGESIRRIETRRKKFFKNLHIKNCKLCDLYNRCGGGCVVDISIKTQRNLMCIKK